MFRRSDPVNRAAPVNPYYTPTLEEQARQDFVLVVKLLANGAMQARVRETYGAHVSPRAAAALGHEPRDRSQIDGDLARTPAFRAWAAVTHRSQTMMWDAIELTTARAAPEASRAAAALRQAPRRGSLELAAGFEAPPPIGTTEIHRQPGGYVAERSADDVSAGLRYLGAALIYSTGKGNPGAGTDARGRFLVECVRERFAGLEPRRILDLGCGIGVASQAIALAWPRAEYHAVDVAAPLLRFAHLLAEERGVPIHFHQRDAAATRFPDGHFDLVLSNILFHETGSTQLPAILRECRRVIAPGGAMLHVDVATQPSRMPLPDQAMNAWQVRWNGEPFWTGFATTDVLREIVTAGFAPDRAFAAHVAKPGGGAWYVFGAQA
jgi:SAM-dependent methyltransferase